MQEDELQTLRAELDSLRQQVASLSSSLKQRTANYTLTHGTRPQLFVAAVDGTDFTELSVVGGVVTSRPTARTGSVIELEDDQQVLLAVRDIGGGGSSIMSHLPLGSGGGGIMRVRLTHTGGDVYSVYPWSDTDKSGPPIATGEQPLGGRPFGTTIDFTAWAVYGIGWYEGSGDSRTFVLAEAFGEQYETEPCPVDEGA